MKDDSKTLAGETMRETGAVLQEATMRAREWHRNELGDMTTAQPARNERPAMPPVDREVLDEALTRWRGLTAFQRSFVFDVLGKTLEVAGAEYSTMFADAFDILIAAGHGQIGITDPHPSAVIVEGVKAGRGMAISAGLIVATPTEHPAVALLRDLEWSGMCAYDETSTCPVCLACKTEAVIIGRPGEQQRSAEAGKHFEGCALAALIGASSPNDRE